MSAPNRAYLIDGFCDAWQADFQLDAECERRLLAAVDRCWLPAYLEHRCKAQEQKYAQEVDRLARKYGRRQRLACRNITAFRIDPAQLTIRQEYELLPPHVLWVRWHHSVYEFQRRLPDAMPEERGRVAVECFMEGWRRMPTVLMEATRGKGALQCLSSEFAMLVLDGWIRAKSTRDSKSVRPGRPPRTPTGLDRETWLGLMAQAHELREQGRATLQEIADLVGVADPRTAKNWLEWYRTDLTITRAK